MVPLNLWHQGYLVVLSLGQHGRPRQGLVPLLDPGQERGRRRLDLAVGQGFVDESPGDASPLLSHTYPDSRRSMAVLEA